MKIRNALWLAGVFSLAAFASNVPAAASGQSGDLLARYHFLGTDRLWPDTNAAQLKAIAELPATVDFRQQVLDKLARAPRQLFSQRVDSGAPDQASLFRPLWEDLARYESRGELRGKAGQPLEWTLAVRLDEARAQVWLANLKSTAEAWNPGKMAACKLEGFEGWQVQGNNGTGLFLCVRAKSWVVVGAGPKSSPTAIAFLKQVKRGDGFELKESDACLAMAADLAALRHWWVPSILRLFPADRLPVVDLTVTAKGGNLRTKAVLDFAQPKRIEWEAWQMPTNIMRDPLISFTAVQGLRPWLKDADWMKTLQVEAPPNQLFIWAQEFIPFMSYFAAPMKQSAQVIEKLALNLPAVLTQKAGTNWSGSITYITNRNQATWSGLPVVTPFITPATGPQEEFLLGGLFTPGESTNAAPAELIAQVSGRRNLLYYEWEITQGRLSQMRLLTQLSEMVFPNLAPGLLHPHSCEAPWLSQVATNLGNTVTEVTADTPRRWTLSRKSQSGFNSLELIRLARWLDDPRFPLFGYALPARPEKPAAGRK